MRAGTAAWTRTAGWRGAMLGVLVSLTLVLTMGAGALSGASASDRSGSATVATGPEAKKPPKKKKWVPASGVIFNDPTVYQRRRVILRQVVRAINGTKKGDTIRVAAWNLDDRPIAQALIGAKGRGVKVKVVVSAIVDNDNWTRLERALNRKKGDGTFARTCVGGCRSRGMIMHAKVFLFSRVNKARTVSMVGSVNLTTPAGNRQWNDLITSKGKPLYRHLVAVFDQYAKRKPIKPPYRVDKIGNYRVTLFPAGNRNPVLRELKRVECRGAKGGTGINGRTQIRIAIAGWFDAYGGEIAERVRRLWDQGCDIKIVTTLAGRGVNRLMRQTDARGPVPMRQVTVDTNYDGIPERYLHMKALAISGVYAGDRSASVVFTGSPNWSRRAQKSDEIWLRVVKRPRLTRRYIGHIDRLFGSPWAAARVTTPAELQRAVDRSTGLTLRRTEDGARLPEWFELN